MRERESRGVLALAGGWKATEGSEEGHYLTKFILVVIDIIKRSSSVGWELRQIFISILISWPT